MPVLAHLAHIAFTVPHDLSLFFILDIPVSSTDSGSPPIGHSPDAHASAVAAANAAAAAAAGQAAHLRLSPLPHHVHHALGGQSSESVDLAAVDLPPRTVVSYKIVFTVVLSAIPIHATSALFLVPSLYADVI